MKRLSARQRIYWLKYAFRSWKHDLNRRERVVKSSEERSDSIAKSRRREINAPTCLDLENNYDETVLFYNDLRSLCSDRITPFKINFTPIKQISPAAALILTAEIDRIMKTRANKKATLSVRDFNNWDRSIQLQLRDMGMFNLLNVEKIPADFWTVPNPTDEKFIKFKSGKKIDGDRADSLNSLISQLTILPQKKYLQIGLTEAMSNSIEHAYPDSYLKDNLMPDKRWWMSASYNVKTNILTVMFYDEGIGIPKSLRKTIGEQFSTLFGTFDDGKLIEAATELNRSRTNELNRGKGLKDIKKYIEMHGKERSQLEIYSLRGYYKYSKDTITKQHEHAIQGTLIEWQVKI